MGLVIGGIHRFRLAQQHDPTEKPDGHRKLHHDLGRHLIGDHPFGRRLEKLDLIAGDRARIFDRCQSCCGRKCAFLLGRCDFDGLYGADFGSGDGRRLVWLFVSPPILCLDGGFSLLDRNFTKAKIAGRLVHLEEVGRYIEEAERADRQETGEARAEKIAHLTSRYHRVWLEMDRMVRLRRELETAPDEQISLTDPDARAMATRAQHSGHVGYNVQSVVDTETHLIVTHEVTNQGHDRDQLASMAGAAKAALRREDLHILADKGYFSGGEILTCHKQGITATVPRPDTSGSRVHGRYVKADFAYDPDNDIYRCPAGEELSYRSTVEQQGLQMRRYWTTGCPDCPLRNRCTTNTLRRISRWEHEHLVEAADARRRDASAPMRIRRSTVEHPFGTIKAWMGHPHFLTRRLANVRTEMALNVLAYNIKRMISLTGIRGLMAAIPG